MRRSIQPRVNLRTTNTVQSKSAKSSSPVASQNASLYGKMAHAPKGGLAGTGAGNWLVFGTTYTAPDFGDPYCEERSLKRVFERNGLVWVTVGHRGGSQTITTGTKTKDERIVVRLAWDTSIAPRTETFIQAPDSQRSTDCEPTQLRATAPVRSLDSTSRRGPSRLRRRLSRRRTWPAP